jgi:hypothetical protein
MKLSLIFLEENKTRIKGLVLLKNGITLTFIDGTNFSFNYLDVDKWSHQGNFTTIHCHDRVLKIISGSDSLYKSSSKTNKGDLPYYLMQKIPHKEASSHVYTMVGMNLLMSYPLIHWTHIYFTSSLGIVYLNYIAVIVFPIILFYLLQKEHLRELLIFYNKDDKNYRQKQNKYFAFIVICYLFIGHKTWDNHKNIKEVQIVEACAQNIKNFDKIDYQIVSDTEFTKNKNVLKAAELSCEQGNKNACRYVPLTKNERNIASE